MHKTSLSYDTCLYIIFHRNRACTQLIYANNYYNIRAMDLRIHSENRENK